MISDSKNSFRRKFFYQTVLSLGFVFCNGGDIKNVGKMKICCFYFRGNYLNAYFSEPSTPHLKFHGMFLQIVNSSAQQFPIIRNLRSEQEFAVSLVKT